VDGDGRPDYLGRTDKDGRFTTIKQQSKLGLAELRNKFGVITRDRMKETKTFIQKMT